jgi:hypothetical protein
VEPSLHPQLKPLEFLLGTWRGTGRGVYPTIEDFTYEEEAVFAHTGRTFLVYSQRTWQPETLRAMHSETGFLRMLEGDRLELVVAHAFGISEVGEGTVNGQGFETDTTALTSTSTAKTVEAVSRSYELTGGDLRYVVGMAFGGHPLQGHLEATLTRA